MKKTPRELVRGVSRLSLNVPVRMVLERGGKRYSGQVVLASRWSAPLGSPPPEGSSFRIVLLTRPAPVSLGALRNERVVVCIPSTPLPLAAAIAEAQVAYQTATTPGEAQWSRDELKAFSSGTVLTGGRSGPDPAALFAGGNGRIILERLAALADLDGLRSQIGEVETYLEAAQPNRTDEELYLDRLSLVEQLAAETVSRDPTLWPSVKALFELFRSRYVGAYIRHHRAYRAETSALRQALQHAGGRARALWLLNGIQELGPPLGEPALAAHEGYERSLIPCGRPEGELTSLEADPLFPSCRAPLNAMPPTVEVRDAIAALDAALHEQQRRLSSEAVRQVLARQGEPRIDQFLRVLQAADVGGLAQVLDQELADFLRRLLGEVTVELPLAPLLRELGDRFPTLGSEEIEAFVPELAELLRQELERARRAHPGKDVRLKIL